MITDDPKASDVIIEKGIATSMFFSFIDQVTREINEFAAASGLITVEDEGTPLTTALEKCNTLQPTSLTMTAVEVLALATI